MHTKHFLTLTKQLEMIVTPLGVSSSKCWATFTIRNDGDQNQTLDRATIALRHGSNWTDPKPDFRFKHVTDVLLPPGGEFTYEYELILFGEGPYIAQPAIEIAGEWIGLTAVPTRLDVHHATGSTALLEPVATVAHDGSGMFRDLRSLLQLCARKPQRHVTILIQAGPYLGDWDGSEGTLDVNCDVTLIGLPDKNNHSAPFVYSEIAIHGGSVKIVNCCLSKVSANQSSRLTMLGCECGQVVAASNATVRLSNCIVAGEEVGIIVNDTAKVEIKSSNITAQETGIQINCLTQLNSRGGTDIQSSDVSSLPPAEVRIESSRIHHVGTGIQSDVNANIHVLGCNIHDVSLSGVHVNDSSGYFDDCELYALKTFLKITSCRISRCGIGIEIGRETYRPLLSTITVTVETTHITHCSSDGMKLMGRVSSLHRPATPNQYSVVEMTDCSVGHCGGSGIHAFCISLQMRRCEIASNHEAGIHMVGSLVTISEQCVIRDHAESEMKCLGANELTLEHTTVIGSCAKALEIDGIDARVVVDHCLIDGGSIIVDAAISVQIRHSSVHAVVPVCMNTGVRGSEISLMHSVLKSKSREAICVVTPSIRDIASPGFVERKWYHWYSIVGELPASLTKFQVDKVTLDNCQVTSGGQDSWLCGMHVPEAVFGKLRLNRCARAYVNNCVINSKKVNKENYGAGIMEGVRVTLMRFISQRIFNETQAIEQRFQEAQQRRSTNSMSSAEQIP